MFLSTLSDDAQAVVVKVSEAVSTALNEFHFSMEAFGDGVGSGEAPHGADGLGPRGECPGKGMEAFEADPFEVVDMLEEGFGVLPAGGFCLSLFVKQVTDLTHLVVERFENRIALQELGQAVLLGGCEVLRTLP